MWLESHIKEEEGTLYVSVVRKEAPRISEKKDLNERDTRSEVLKAPPHTIVILLTVLMFK